MNVRTRYILLSVVEKVYGRILVDSVRRITDGIIAKEQCALGLGEVV